MLAQQAGDWLSDFRSYTWFHAVTVAVCAASMVGSMWLGRRFMREPGGEAAERRFRMGWGWVVLLFQLYQSAWYMAPSRWDIADSLPLQLCDLAGFVAAGAMLTRVRWLRTLLYFWGIGLSTQAFFSPIVELGAGHTRFWLFWMSHTMIVGSAFYDVVVCGYRPRWRDVLVAAGVSVVYVIGALILNVTLDVNYGYVGNQTPTRPTIIDRLGPWPGRVFIVSGLVLADFVLLRLVWVAADLARGRRGGSAGL